jgi:valyl-tRNA synthetase
MGNLSAIHYVNTKTDNVLTFLIKSSEYYIPVDNAVNVEEERRKLEAELKYTEGFLKNVVKKLDNERFVNNAPDKVVETERKKQQDAEAKIKVIKEQIQSLK